MMKNQRDYYAGKFAAIEYLMYMVHERLFLAGMDDEDIRRRFALYFEEDEEQGDFGKGWDSVLRSLAEKALEARGKQAEKAATPG